MTAPVIFRNSAAADSDHFSDVNEMVINSLSAVETGQARLADNLFKIPVIVITQDIGKIAAGPIFAAGIVRPANSFKR